MSISGNQALLVTMATLTTIAAPYPPEAAHKTFVSPQQFEQRRQVTLASNPEFGVAWQAPNTLAGEPRLRNAEVARSLKAQRTYLLGLPENWDGYGARRVSEALLDRLEGRLVAAVGAIDCRAPDLIPGGDGSIQAEWHNNGLMLIYNVRLSGAEFFSVTTPEVDLEFFDEDALPAFRTWAPRLAKKAVAVALAA